MTPQTPAERVAAEVRAALARQARPQKYVCQVLGLSRSSVARRLSGQTAFDVEELHKLAIALGVPVSDFMAGAA